MGLPPIENREVPSGIRPRPWVARIAVQRLVLRDRHDGHCRHSGVYSGMTWSPFFTLVTPRPISATTPAPSWPRIAGNSPSGSAPDNVNSSVWQTPVALISTSTSPSRGPSSWTVDISSGRPAATATAARTSMSSSLFLDFRYVIPGRRTRAFRDCRIAYVQAIRAANEQGLRKFSRARGAGDFCRALEYRLHRHQIRAAQRRAADLSHNPDGFGGGAD